MKQIKICWFTALVLLLSSFGCSSKNEEIVNNIELEVTPNSIEIIKSGGEYEVGVKSNYIDWIFECSDDDVNWLNPSKTKNGLKFLVVPNNTLKERSSTIIIKAGSGENAVEKELNITQLLVNDLRLINFDKEFVNFDYVGGIQKIAVRGNSKLTGALVPEEYRKYFSVVATGSIVTIVAKENKTMNPIDTEIHVFAGNKKGSIKVKLDFKKKELYEVIQVDYKKAIVFHVNDDGSGKAVSVEEFSNNDIWNMNISGWKDINGNKIYGAVSCYGYGGKIPYLKSTKNNGQKNMNLWREYHHKLMEEKRPPNIDPNHKPFAPALNDSPAYLWCEYRNSDRKTDWYLRNVSSKKWYLPSIDELKLLADLYQKNPDKLNSILRENNGVTMGNEIWSSTDTESNSVYYIDMIEGVTKLTASHNSRKGVRAIIEFEK